MKKIFLLPFLLLTINSCHTPKALKAFSKNELIFGSGGGFTGMSDTYSLAYDGIISKTNEITREAKKVGKIPKKESKKLFITFLNNGLDTLTISKPANMYYFLGFKNDSLNKKIVWSSKEDIPEVVQKLFTELTNKIHK